LTGKTKDNKYTWRAQYNEKLYAVFGKNESFLKKRINRLFFNLIRYDDLLHGRGLWFKSGIAHAKVIGNNSI
jgi:hypothetical protein